MKSRVTPFIALGSLLLVISSTALGRAIRVDSSFWTIFYPVPSSDETETGGLSQLSYAFVFYSQFGNGTIFSEIDPGVGPGVTLWLSQFPGPDLSLSDDIGLFQIFANSSYILSWNNLPAELLPIPSSDCPSTFYTCPSQDNPLQQSFPQNVPGQLNYPGPTAEVGIYNVQYDPANSVNAWEIVFNYNQLGTSCPIGVGGAVGVSPTFTVAVQVAEVTAYNTNPFVLATYQFTGAGGVTSPCDSTNDILFTNTGVVGSGTLIGYLDSNDQQQVGLPPGWAELVPSVFGLSENAAATLLNEVGLAVGTVTYQPSNTVAAGLVISNFFVGYSLAPGSAVDLVVSSGPLRGDINGDGQVDKVDLALITSALNKPASGPDDLRDLNHDGVVNALDARILVTLCTHPRCAIH